ncbi:MAG: hypothetical protein MJ152_04420, partial [Clostridia bacterium]|nr:hypothetical protein [Clostridia bacterium]
YAAVLGVALVEDPFFVKYFLPIVEFVLLVLLFTLNQIFVLGWSASIIVFDCGVCKAYRKGLKAAFRHFWKTFGIAALYFAMFWALVLIFGIYTMTILVPLATVLISVYDMTIFFTSQGMRFYVNKTQIMTPKKLEEVDNINKTAFIL